MQLPKECPSSVDEALNVEARKLSQSSVDEAVLCQVVI